MFISKKKFEQEKLQWYTAGRNEEKWSKERAIKQQTDVIKTCIALLPNIQLQIGCIANEKKVAERRKMSMSTASDIDKIAKTIEKALKEILL